MARFKAKVVIEVDLDVLTTRRIGYARKWIAEWIEYLDLGIGYDVRPTGHKVRKTTITKVRKKKGGAPCRRSRTGSSSSSRRRCKR